MCDLFLFYFYTSEDIYSTLGNNTIFEKLDFIGLKAGIFCLG